VRVQLRQQRAGHAGRGRVVDRLRHRDRRDDEPADHGRDDRRRDVGRDDRSADLLGLDVDVERRRVRRRQGCDDGNQAGGDGCSPGCAPEGCGDGVTQQGEACDDGNLLDGDGCSSVCNVEFCGDGVVQGGEACDDGNMDTSDMCPMGCHVAACGDGFVYAGFEMCDDGNMNDGDGCTNACMVNARRVFVSSSEYQGNLGGIAGADGKCQTLANGAGLGGTWMAWITTGSSSTSPENRFPTKSAGPYVKVDGGKVADSWDDLTDGGLDSAINRDEFGAVVMGESEVWTNTTPGGNMQFGDYECYNWTDNGQMPDANGQIGSLQAVNGGWTDVNQIRDCASGKRIYCFEQ
jgi:cysteine-rich repeat protein